MDDVEEAKPSLSLDEAKATLARLAERARSADRLATELQDVQARLTAVEGELDALRVELERTRESFSQSVTPKRNSAVRASSKVRGVRRPSLEATWEPMDPPCSVRDVNDRLGLHGDDLPPGLLLRLRGAGEDGDDRIVMAGSVNAPFEGEVVAVALDLIPVVERFSA